ncbi:MAG: ATP-binding protein [Deltaproteobacteria bacterium]|nr:ATP-binding protein [Deltaproteobacteria bacterium]
MKLRPVRRVAIALAIGAALGVVLLHPATMAVYWLEFHADLGHEWSRGWQFIADRMLASFTWKMAPMTLLFASLGALVGGVYAALDARFRRSERAISYLEREVARELPSLIRSGEGEHVEFKSTARWDLRANKVNRVLSDIVVQTIAGFANSSGGSLLIGVGDDGGIVGLGPDYATLKKKDRDGFAQFIMTLVFERLGGQNCRFVHVLFAEVEGHDVCRIIVEPADAPVYVHDGKKARFFLRTGNATRELDAREVIQYALSRSGTKRG